MTRLAVAALALALAMPAAAVAQEADLAAEQAMLDQINALRAEHQLAPVARLGELDAVARAHTEEMARNAALAHVSTTSGTPEDRVRNAGVEAGAVTENVAMHADAAQAHQALLASAPHRGNMLNPDITHVGVSAIRADNATYVTQLFVERRAAAPAPPPVAPALEAPVEALSEAASAQAAPAFGIIPPFVERAAEVSAPLAEAAAPAIDAADGAILAPADAAGMLDADPSDAEAAGPEVASPEVASPEMASPEMTSPEMTSPEMTSPEMTSPEMTSPEAAAPAAGSQDALRQLVGIGQALLRAVTAPAAQ